MQSLQDENMALRSTLQEMSRFALPAELAAEQPVQVHAVRLSGKFHCPLPIYSRLPVLL